MFYNFAISVTAGTTEADPVDEELQLVHGVIHRVIVMGRPGMNGVVKVRVYHYGHQIIPTNPDDVVLPCRWPLVYPEHHRLTVKPYTLRVIAYSPDARYNHTFEISVGILPEEVLVPFTGIAPMFKKFFKLLGVK